MDRRTVIALLLVAVVVLITPRLFPTRPTAAAAKRDTVVATPSTTREKVDVAITAEAPAGVMAPRKLNRPVEAAPLIEVSSVEDSLAKYEFSSLGAAIRRVDLKKHRGLGSLGGNASLVDADQPLIGYRVLVDGDTVSFRETAFATLKTAGALGVDFQGKAKGIPAQIQYRVVPDSYVVRVTGRIGAEDSTDRRPAFLLLDLPATLQSFEADTLADQASLSYAVKPARRSAEAIPFRDLDPGERRIVAGPVSWAVAKNKYFMFGVLVAEDNESIAEVQAVGGTRSSKVPTHASATLVTRLGPDGSFAFEFYTGPQEYRRLRALGRDFENSNPYGGWMQGFVQPFATIVMRILLWMKEALPISYGWLLVVFGVAVRLILWPLNQGAMRTSMKMQRIQPELNAIQTKFKSDPQRLQSEMMKVYKEHNMSPFSAFAGCLPLLLPMPILFALFFVFQNTIEFRGVPFLWLSDISLKDPYYIIPLFMGVSMFVMSWVGLRNAPPNPQAKMMAWVLPIVMTVMFANFASGLNLYYAVQNVAAIPQQWLIANERSKSAAKKA
jgi:YidC/Oxa1 family membrane protein insertase